MGVLREAAVRPSVCPVPQNGAFLSYGYYRKQIGKPRAEVEPPVSVAVHGHQKWLKRPRGRKRNVVKIPKTKQDRAMVRSTTKRE